MTRIEDKSGPVLAFRVVAHIVLILLIVQPILAGQFLTGSAEDERDIHGIIGDVLQLGALIMLILSFLARRTFGIGLVVYCLVFLILLVAQNFLGRSDDLDATAIHIPLGTILLTLGTFAVFLSFFDLRRQRRLEPTESIDTR